MAGQVLSVSLRDPVISGLVCLHLVDPPPHHGLMDTGVDHDLVGEGLHGGVRGYLGIMALAVIKHLPHSFFFPLGDVVRRHAGVEVARHRGVFMTRVDYHTVVGVQKVPEHVVRTHHLLQGHVNDGLYDGVRVFHRQGLQAISHDRPVCGPHGVGVWP